MNIIRESDASHGRLVVLWTCIGLFYLRVVGQLEVLLVAPPWLPAMDAWYSGLIAYPILVPVQIGILMLMPVLVTRDRQRRRCASGDGGKGMPWVRRFAVAYFVVMMLRLMLQFLRGAENVVDAGGIPVAFHWVLALFLLVLGRASFARHSWSGAGHAHGVLSRTSVASQHLDSGRAKRV